MFLPICQACDAPRFSSSYWGGLSTWAMGSATPFFVPPLDAFSKKPYGTRRVLGIATSNTALVIFRTPGPSLDRFRRTYRLLGTVAEPKYEFGEILHFWSIFRDFRAFVWGRAASRDATWVSLGTDSDKMPKFLGS